MSNLYAGAGLGDLIVGAILRYADKPAIADERARWTYRELGETIGRVMTFFRTIGLKKGDAVSVLSGNRVESWAVVCAAAIMGLRYTPLHPLAAEDDHAFIVDDAGIDALVVESGKFAARGLATDVRPTVTSPPATRRRAARARTMVSAFQPATQSSAACCRFV